MRYIFVGGCARSGTSLVQKLLISHSQVLGGPEFDHTAAIFDLYQEMARPWRLERQSFFYDQDGLADSFRRFYRGFFTSLEAASPAASFISEKTPGNIFAAETLLELWPDALFVNVVRDGRDVVLSHQDVNRRYRQRGERNPENDSVLSVSRHWNACAEKYFSLAGRPDLKDRVLLVEFERLVAEPGRELERLCGFLGLPVEDRQRYPEHITEEDTKVALEGAYFTQALYRQPFNEQKSMRWRREMNPAMRMLTTGLMKTNLRRLGYPV